MTPLRMPAAETAVSADLVRRLLTDQHQLPRTAWLPTAAVTSRSCSKPSLDRGHRRPHPRRRPVGNAPALRPRQTHPHNRPHSDADPRPRHAPAPRGRTTASSTGDEARHLLNLLNLLLGEVPARLAPRELSQLRLLPLAQQRRGIVIWVDVDLAERAVRTWASGCLGDGSPRLTCRASTGPRPRAGHGCERRCCSGSSRRCLSSRGTAAPYSRASRTGTRSRTTV